MSSTDISVDNAAPKDGTGSQVQFIHPKRNRAQLSCNHCRHGKLKCDRNQPCNQCTKRDRGSICVYSAPPARQRPTKTVQKRLNHLESLVKNMMNNGIVDTPPSVNSSPLEGTVHTDTSPSTSIPSQGTQYQNGVRRKVSSAVKESSTSTQVQVDSTDDVSQTANAFGRVVLNPHETTYVGATHWAAILDELSEVKNYFDEETPEDADEENHPTESQQEAPSMLLGMSKVSNKSDILVTLPSRSVVDRLVSRYFNSNHPAMNIIHKPTFQREYQEFWESPYDKPVMWIGLLFGMMSLASFFAFRAGDEPIESRAPTMELVHLYRTRCSQSLILGQYTKPGQYTIETLVLYFEGEFTMKGDAQARCWLLNGMTVRLSLRMGCHRDAANHPNISVFQGEMRRRIWHLIIQFELLLSFHVGLPSMIQGIQSDTLPPRNLFDTDFGPESLELPPSRPETELTPNTYTICKVRIAKVFGKIAEQANALARPSYDEVMELDKRLRAAFGSLPDALMVRPLDQSVTDSTDTIMQRFNLVLLFHKSLCVLHRRYLSTECTDDRFSYSRSTCLSSALEILQFQYAIHEACAPGGPLSRHRWFLNTLTIHDFLLASMILYLFLTEKLDVQFAMNGTSNESIDSLQHDMLKVLEVSYDIWTKCTTATGDAIRAKGVLEVMLINLRKRGFIVDILPQPKATPQIARPFEPPSVTMSEEYMPYNQLPQVQFEELGSMMETPMNFDWGLWDAQVNSAEDTLPSWPPPDSAAFPMQQDTQSLDTPYPPNVAFSVLQNMNYDDPLGTDYL